MQISLYSCSSCDYGGESCNASVLFDHEFVRLSSRRVRSPANQMESIHLVLHGSLPLRWASYLQECLRELQQNGEWEGDEILVQQVRIQKMIEKAIAFKEWEASSEASGSGHSPATTFYVPSLRAELEGIKESIRGRKLLENGKHSASLH